LDVRKFHFEQTLHFINNRLAATWYTANDKEMIKIRCTNDCQVPSAVMTALLTGCIRWYMHFNGFH